MLALPVGGWRQVGAERIDAAATRVLTRAVPTSVGPDALYAALAREGAASVWWNPTAGPERGTSFIGFASSPDDLLVVRRADPVDTGPFADALRERLARTPADTALLGWWGSLSYEFGVAAAGLPVADDVAPFASFAFVDRGIVLAADRSEVVLIALEGALDAQRWFDRTAARIAGLAPAPPETPPGPARWLWRRAAPR